MRRDTFVVTVGAAGCLRVIELYMTIRTLQHLVHFIELKTGDGMIEVLLIPPRVAAGALVVEGGYRFARRMTGATLKGAVIFIKGPTG